MADPSLGIGGTGIWLNSQEMTPRCFGIPVVEEHSESDEEAPGGTPGAVGVEKAAAEGGSCIPAIVGRGGVGEVWRGGHVCYMITGMGRNGVSKRQWAKL